ncbi:hypothetical protein Barb7_02444 [Bacteroidales bacterium Barb7]|nr:hypothetical protein Barb7_02444 [Bacteroidales bacterium Barb7]
MLITYILVAFESGGQRDVSQGVAAQEEERIAGAFVSTGVLSKVSHAVFAIFTVHYFSQCFVISRGFNDPLGRRVLL